MKLMSRLRSLNLVIFALCVGLYSFLVLGPTGQYLTDNFIRLFLFGAFVLICSILLKAWSHTRGKKRPKDWLVFIGISMTLIAFVYKTASFLTDISPYPLTLTWSETSRYYYASLFFSERIYGYSVPPTVLHPSRYLMQSLPFLLPGSPLWFHRAWQVFLWLATPLVTAYFLVRRLSIKEKQLRWFLIIWSSLFILLGPIYYHLLIPVIMVLWGFNTDSNRSPKLRLVKSIIVVLLASAWAGISRVNWYPVPGLLAAALFFLEEPIEDYQQTTSRPNYNPTQTISFRAIITYLLKPTAWVILGALTAFAAQAFYIAWSGNAAEDFATSFTSSLLWHRLLPNPTYPPGILPGILVVSLPMYLLILSTMIDKHAGVTRWQQYHITRLLGLITILLILFTGGIIVSVKIGGGSNLHNLDAYIILLLVITAYIFFDKTTPDNPEPRKYPAAGEQLSDDPSPTISSKEGPPKRQTFVQAVRYSGIILAILIPSTLTILSGGPKSPLPEQLLVENSLETIIEFAQAASKRGGEVLFISNRHLLSFQEVKNVLLAPEYERVFLMEMAMADNTSYLNRFYRDLKNHRFALIISEPLSTIQKDGTERFGVEDNAWVKNISRPLLCYYKPEKTLRAVQVQLLVPNPDIQECP